MAYLPARKPLRKTLAHRPIFLRQNWKLAYIGTFRFLRNQVGSCMIPSPSRCLPIEVKSHMVIKALHKTYGA